MLATEQRGSGSGHESETVLELKWRAAMHDVASGSAKQVFELTARNLEGGGLTL